LAAGQARPAFLALLPLDLREQGLVALKLLLLSRGAVAVGLLGREHPAVLAEGERPQVEHFVVQDAQVQAVRLLVGAGGLDPADVGGLGRSLALPKSACTRMRKPL
jgi:hypothetical protein